MRLPIQYAFSCPERWDGAAAAARPARLRPPRVRAAGPRPVPLPAPRLRALEAGGAYPGRAERGQRGRRGVFPRGRGARSRRSPTTIDAALDEAARQGVQPPDIARGDPGARRLGPHAYWAETAGSAPAEPPRTRASSRVHISGVSLRPRRARVRARAGTFPARALARRPRAHVLARLRPQAAQDHARRHRVLHQRRSRSAAT